MEITMKTTKRGTASTRGMDIGCAIYTLILKNLETNDSFTVEYSLEMYRAQFDVDLDYIGNRFLTRTKLSGTNSTAFETLKTLTSDWGGSMNIERVWSGNAVVGLKVRCEKLVVPESKPEEKPEEVEANS